MQSTDASEDGTVLMGELKLGAGESIYSKFGNWFGWTCVVLLIFLSVFLAGMNKKSRH
jgi:apolipoprotein N-acyltransferase